jgi:two-component system phosphate regulon response regulator PhoB
VCQIEAAMNAIPAAAARERVLVVEDEDDIRQLVAFNLRDAGYDVVDVATGQDALVAARESPPAVIVLDLMLPDMTGIQVCSELRADAATADVCIMMLTARDHEYDRLLGFQVGADDYVVKPFSVRELVFRVRALMRRPVARASAPLSSRALAFASTRAIAIDRDACRVTIDGELVALRPLEYKLLAAFVARPDHVLSRRDLLNDVWGIDDPQASTRTVDTHVRRLRERLGRHHDAIETVQGFGYRWRAAHGSGGNDPSG